MKALELVAMVLCCMVSFGCVEEAQTPHVQAQPSQTAPLITIDLSSQNQEMPVNPPMQPASSPPSQPDCLRWLPSGAAGPAYETTPLTTWGHSMEPFFHDNEVLQWASVPASEVRVGDVVVWSLSSAQKTAEENVNLTDVAIRMQLGIPIQVPISFWGKNTFGTLHQVVWRNETHFITQGTNAATNKEIDMMPPQSFAENYRAKVVLDGATQAQLYQFWRDNRQSLAYDYGHDHHVAIWQWCDSDKVS
jgi:hypothetical protein